jgi:hypothetical protein
MRRSVCLQAVFLARDPLTYLLNFADHGNHGWREAHAFLPNATAEPHTSLRPLTGPADGLTTG